MTKTPQPWPEFRSTDDPVDQLVGLSRFYGADPEFVKGGGGNTSVKVAGRMWVKASGSHLGEIDREDFVELDLAALAAVVRADFGSDTPACEERFCAAVNAARLHPEKRQVPSLETTLHSQMPNRFVVHNHSTVVNCLTCCVRGEALTTELFGDDGAWMPYTNPGIARARALCATLEAYTRRTGRATPRVVVMENHGSIIGGETPEEVRETTGWVVATIQRLLDAKPDAEPFGPVRRLDPIHGMAVGAEIRSLLGEVLRARRLDSHLVFDGSAPALSLAGGRQGRDYAALGPLTPQQLAYCHGSFPLWLKPEAAGGPDGETATLTAADLDKAIAGHIAASGFAPHVFLVEGLGLFAAGEDAADAEIVRSLYVDAIELMAGAKRLGGIRALTAADREYMETWLQGRA